MADEIKTNNGESKKDTPKKEYWIKARIKSIKEALKSGKSKEGKDYTEIQKSFLRGELNAYNIVYKVQLKHKLEKEGKWIPEEEYKKKFNKEEKTPELDSKDEKVDDEKDEDIPF